MPPMYSDGPPPMEGRISRGPVNVASPVDEGVQNAHEAVQTIRDRLIGLRMQREQLDNAISSIEKELTLLAQPAKNVLTNAGIR